MNTSVSKPNAEGIERVKSDEYVFGRQNSQVSQMCDRRDAPAALAVVVLSPADGRHSGDALRQGAHPSGNY